MKRKHILASVAFMLVAAGCNMNVDSGPTQTATDQIDVGKAETVTAEINMGAGRLDLEQVINILLNP